MFKVDVDNLQAYFDFDLARRGELEKLDDAIRHAAPELERHFHAGTPAGSAGMRMKMIGYGQFRYTIKSGKATVAWPVIGVALQMRYISVYLSVTRDNTPLVDFYTGTLGELRTGRNNFSFERFDDLDCAAVTALFTETATIFTSDIDNPARYQQTRRKIQL